MRSPGRVRTGCIVSAAAIALVSATASAAAPQPRIGGGSEVAQGQAPWVAVVTSSTPQGGGYCTGSVIDPVHVLTAAHCTYNGDGTPQSPANLAVGTGVTKVGQSSPPPQIRFVAAVARHPYYAGGIEQSGAAFVDALDEADIALLTLASPLDFSGPDTKPIALPGRKTKVFGKPLTVFGWGEIADGVDSDRLRALGVHAVPAGNCMQGVPAMLCIVGPTGDVCHGDSGGGAVLSGRGPVLVGVHSASTSGCAAGGAGTEVDLRAPEISAWLRTGTATPPRGPRLRRPPRLKGHGPHALRCSPGRWTGHPKHSFRIFHAVTGKTIKKFKKGRRPIYRLRKRDRGHILKCADAAKNKGASAEAVSLNAQQITG